MTVTDDIRARTGLCIGQEYWTYLPGYTMFNTSSVECEVGEFLWALVRLVKPGRILETGTSHGISAAYMALALKENGRGRITTMDIGVTPNATSDATWLFNTLDVSDRIEQLAIDARNYTPDGLFEILFLDTEPGTRFAELTRFWESLREGGFVLIHDLHPNMSQTHEEVNGFKDWPFGTLPKEIESLIETGELQSFHFTTPRGLYMGQKASPRFYSTSILKGTPWTAWNLDPKASHL